MSDSSRNEQTAGELLSRVEGRSRREANSRYRAEEGREDLPSSKLDGQAFSTHLLLALCREGIKPVAKIELVTLKEAEALIDLLELPNARTRTPSTGGDNVEIFFGCDPTDVKRAVEVSARAATPRNAEDFYNSTRAIGALLGYPDCCVETFVNESPRALESYVWLQLDRRYSTPREVHPGMNPWPGVFSNQYVPCSYDCKATIELIPQVLEIATSIAGTDWYEANLTRSTHPWLVILRGQGSALELIPKGIPGDHFYYTPGMRVGEAPELDLLANTDEIVLELERVLVRREGALAADLTARAFVWWHERTLQTELWERVLALRTFHDPPVLTHDDTASPPHQPVQPIGEETDAVRPDQGLTRLQRALETALEEILDKGLTFGELASYRIWVRSHSSLGLRLGGRDDAIQFIVTDVRQDEPRLFCVGPFAFTYPQDTPLDTPARHRAARDLGQHIRTWFKARYNS